MRDWNAVANRDGIVSYQDVFHHEPHDSLPLSNTQRISGATQAAKERCKILRQAQKSGPIISLIGDCLQLSAGAAPERGPQSLLSLWGRPHHGRNPAIKPL